MTITESALAQALYHRLGVNLRWPLLVSYSRFSEQPDLACDVADPL